MSEKTLGQIAYEAAYKDMDATYPWERVPIEEHGHWEAAAQAVIRAAEAKPAGIAPGWELVEKIGK